MAPLVSVLTPTVLGREDFLAECVSSVKGQECEFPTEHLVKIDVELGGCAISRNQLATLAGARWLLPLDDDDVLLPDCLQTLMERAENERTVVYPRPLVWGEDHHQFWGQPPDIPATALISRALWMEIGGLDVRLREREDQTLWTRAREHGATFVCVDDRPTWVYRFHGGNKSRNGGRIP